MIHSTDVSADCKPNLINFVMQWSVEDTPIHTPNPAGVTITGITISITCTAVITAETCSARLLHKS